MIFELPLILWGVNFILIWSENFVITDMATLAVVPVQGDNPRTLPIAALTGAEFIIIGRKPNVAIVILSNQTCKTIRNRC